MVPSDESEIRRLIREAYFAGHTPTGMALAEQAVKLADAYGDDKLSYQARSRYVEQAVFCGYSDKAVTAYVWQLAYADRHPEEVEFWELLWMYKWIIPRLVQFPSISRQRIMDAVDDYRRRSEKAGFGIQAAENVRWKVTMQMGWQEEAVRLRKEARKLGKGTLSDCPACVRNADVRWYSKLGQHAKAIDHASPILSGRMTCAEVPHVTHAELLRSYVAEGRLDEARTCHETGLRLIAGGGDFNSELASHVDYLARFNPAGGAKLLQRHFLRINEDRSPLNRFLFLLASRNLVRELAKGDAVSLRIALPQEAFPFAGKTTVKFAPFLQWLEQDVSGVAGLFDQRNGNDYFGRMLNSEVLI